jgi:hypothetical protein
MFSVPGRVSCTSRTSLSSLHVSELCYLHQWLVDEGVASKEAANSSERRCLKSHQEVCVHKLAP